MVQAHCKRHKKVILINLPSPWLISDRDTTPNGILYIAAYLRKKGIPVSITDLAGLPEEHWLIPDADIYGISITTPQYPYALKVVRKLKKRQDCKIILGGAHPVILPEKTSRETGVDHIIVGEGEKAMERICLGKEKRRIVYEPLIKDIDEIPAPAVDLIDIYEYLSIGTNAYIAGAKREAYIQTARGCPYNCAFCCQRNIWRGKVRNRSLKKVMEEVDNYLKRYKVDQIYFNDDTFILDEKRVYALCKEMKKRKVVWHCLSRADRVNPKILKKMYSSGCRALTYGIESGSDKILKLMNKMTNAKTGYGAVCMAKNAGLKVRAQMIVGFPGETDETIKETAKFIKKTPADAWGFHAFVPFPGCDVWNNPKKYNFKIKSRNFGNFHTIGKPGEWKAIIHPQADKVRKWLKFLISIANKKNIFYYDVKGRKKFKKAVKYGEEENCQKENKKNAKS